MSDEKRLVTLSEEIKLLKGEIKNSLTSVRDYLLNMELPSSEFSTILAALSGDNSGQKVNLDGGLGQEPDNKIDEAAQEPEATADDLVQPPPDEDLLDMEQPEDLMDNIPEGEPLSQDEETEGLIDGEDTTQPDDEMLEESEELENPENLEESETGDLEDEEGEEEEVEETEDSLEDPEEDELEFPEDENEDSGPVSEMPAEEELPMELERTTADNNNPGTPRVNMLANLINWVSRAKREIGDDMLPTFLDVYGVSGHLSLELKEVILHLAERTKEKTEPCTDAEVWSQAMLSLHGILTGGDAPLNPAIPAWREALEEESDEEIIEVDKQDRPIKLKFVLPSVNGKDKEYCLDLTPEDDGND
jgi:hypothetical protein